MDDFPAEISVLIVDELYDNYDLGFEDAAGVVHVYCEQCDDIVCVLDYETIKDETEHELYGTIVEYHRPL